MAKIKLIAGVSLICLFLMFVAGKSLYLYIQAQKDYKRVISNQVSLTDSLKYYRDRSGRETAVSRVLEYKLDEVLTVLPELQSQLHDLKIKPSRVETISETGVNQQVGFTRPLRDTTIIFNNVVTPVKSLTYRDPWHYVFGIIHNDTAKLQISSYDTLIQVVSRGDRIHPWRWFFSKREIIQSIQSRNPSNHITYSRYIKIKE